MSTMSTPRRLTDRIILYGSVIGAAATILAALRWTGNTYTSFSSAMVQVPDTAARVEKLERWREIQDERTYNIEWWMSKMGEQMGIPSPPPRRHHVRDQEVPQ